MELHGRISLQKKQICLNCFVLEQVLVVLDIEFNKDASDGRNSDVAAASMPGLSSSMSLLSLLILSVSQKPDDNSRSNIAYRRLFSYHRLAHGLAYTRNNDNRLVEPHCSMFLQGSLTFSISHR